MANWSAPLREYQFVLEEMLDPTLSADLPGHEDAPPELCRTILAEAGKFFAETLLPLNRIGDQEGCRIEHGRVKTPTGFRAAYRDFSAAGWTSLGADPRYGGQGLPHILNNLVEEMLCSANHGFGMYPGLTNAAYQAILTHGGAEIRDTYLPKLVSGEWLGTMNLTEPQCGTDLGLTRTRAIPDADDSYRLTGTKMFISGGDHDLTDNIVHLVLARLPDAPSGTRGLSLFVVPRILPATAGRDAAANHVSCGSIEHKMGVRGSATCVMNYDGAVGWLIGEPNKGLAAMFTMMNIARLSVATQAVGIAETALQSARAYANERIQGRAPGGIRAPDRPADPLIAHPDIRRTLLTIRAYVEGGRALTAWIAQSIDIAHRHPDAATRLAAEDLASLLTPVAKAFITDTAFESCVAAQQVFGGHGYIAEWGMEQLVRDVRVTQIYEGANGIQALDLVGRKLQLGGGRLPPRFFEPVEAYLTLAADQSAVGNLATPALHALRLLRTVTETLSARSVAEQAAGATDYLRLFGLTALGYLWTRAAAIAATKLEGEDAVFYRGKLATARFFMMRLLPQTNACAAASLSNSEFITKLADEAI